MVSGVGLKEAGMSMLGTDLGSVYERIDFSGLGQRKETVHQ